MKTPSLDVLCSEMGLRVPEILLPRADADLKSWAVIACDQHTSDPGYWDQVSKERSGSLSTLDLILPEVYLSHPQVQRKISTIHNNMKTYLEADHFQHFTGFILVERKTEKSGLRQGLIVALDLEHYDHSPNARTLIRATEGTILERIPPRVKIRANASLELPHIMVLIDDPEQTVIEALAEKKDTLEKLYETDLMLDGGHISGYGISDQDQLVDLLGSLAKLNDSNRYQQRYGDPSPFLFAMGDGNHSLATAKAVWESTKRELKPEQLATHPARFALVELVNLHSPGLRFEPIHRIAKGISFSDFSKAAAKRFPTIVFTPCTEEECKTLINSPEGKDHSFFYDGSQWYSCNTAFLGDGLPPAKVDMVLNGLTADNDDSEVDYIHGWDENKALASRDNTAIFVPVIARDDLFAYVATRGPLPRKSFSMGDAEEKRYYLESRVIR